MNKRAVRLSHLVVAGHLMAIALVVSTCDVTEKSKDLSGVVHFSGQEFAGSNACMDCHPSVTASHRHTPHFLTSRIADSKSVLGSFDSGMNVVVLNERLKYMMDQTDEGLFQRGFVDGEEVEKKPLDLVIGSGRQGQTYLYWHQRSLFQLPVSYYQPLGIWTNSPGYPRDQIVFNRSIPARCLECHSTYFRAERMIGGNETFDPGQAMLGIDCERCHGPAARHVTFHRSRPDEAEARYVVNPATLTRQQRLDNCALCHSGIRDNLMPSFSFMVGDALDDFSFPVQADSGATLDVHGNQYGLLTASKCFSMSDMDCSSCHDVHTRETGRLDLFSARCMNCHQQGSDHFCTQPVTEGLSLTSNCIDCHMPALPSRQVFVSGLEGSKPTPFFVRTHLVGTYTGQVKAFLEKIGNGRAGTQ